MEQTAQTISKKPKIKLDFKDSKYATGRRKKSIAKIWLKKGTGKIYVNGRSFEDYFSRRRTWQTLAALFLAGSAAPCNSCSGWPD